MIQFFFHNRLAQVTVKFAIAMIIKNFKVSLDTDAVKLPLKFDPKSASLALAGGFWVHMEKI